MLRSEGLKALPLIATSVTRHVKVDLHVVEKQEEKEEHDSLCKDKCFLYQVLAGREEESDETIDTHAHLRNTIIVTIAFFRFFC